MLTLAILAAVCLNPVAAPVTDRVDLVEVNHFYDENAKLVFSQIIWYAFDGWEGRYNVVAWRLMKSETQRPFREQGGYVCRWRDGETLREVRASQFRESWLQHDPEIDQRAEFPKEERRELSRPPARPQ